MSVTDWSKGDARSHLAYVRGLPEARLRAAARGYDWSRYPETVLGWIMAQKCLDLDTALAAFFEGAPERFNYLHKRQVPPEFAGACRVLDNICLRVNSGFYLPGGVRVPEMNDRLVKWLAVQKIDRGEGASGRWVFDEEIVEPVLREPAPEPCTTVGEPRLERPAPRSPLQRMFGLLRPQSAG